MPSWGDITARVRIGKIPYHCDDEDNSKELPEYLVESRDDDGVPCVSCWVPSIANEPFALWWMDKTVPRDASRGDVTIDGVELPDSYFIHPSRGKYRGNCQYAVVDEVTSETGIRQMVFAPVVLSDSDDVDSASVLFGELHLLLTQISMTKKSKKQANTHAEPFKLQPMVHERSKKAGSHSVQLGPAAIGIASYPDFGLDYKEVAPLVKFIFRYRPLEILKANGIVPSEAEPVDSTANSEASVEPPVRVPSPESAPQLPAVIQHPLAPSLRTVANDSPESGIKTEDDQRELDELREKEKRLETETRETRERIARLERVNGMGSSSSEASFKRELDPQLKTDTSPRRRSKKAKTWQPPNPEDVICID